MANAPRSRSNQRTMNRPVAAVAGPFRPARSSMSPPPAPTDEAQEFLSFDDSR